MKFNLILLGLFIFTFTIPINAQDSASEKTALELLKKYNKDGYFIIDEYIKAPSKYKFGSMSTAISKNNSFKRYISGSGKQNIVSSLGTVVHEMNHAFSGVYSYQKVEDYKFGAEYECCFIKDDQFFIVKHTETFPSKLFASKVPKELQTFRFETYISKSMKFQSTQSSGIYGLLDEFNSYYQGTKTSYLMYDYYKNETEGEKKDWFNYMSNFDGTYFAYAEFRFYILKYLLYAKKYKKNIYQGILNNTEFKKAFNTIDSEFSSLITNYFNKRDIILKEFEDKGHETSIGKEFTRIDGSGVGHYMDVYNKLMSEMKKSEYVSMLQELKN